MPTLPEGVELLPVDTLPTLRPDLLPGQPQDIVSVTWRHNPLWYLLPSVQTDGNTTIGCDALTGPLLARLRKFRFSP